jgi:biopolymer transport protein ExbD
MISLRRSAHETRVEIMPLIDVIFLLLTFFIYAMVLMVRAELMPIPLQSYLSGERATPKPAVTVSITLDGGAHFNRDPIEIVDIIERIRTAQAMEPDTVVYIALEDGEGEIDRGPLLTSLIDQLTTASIEFSLVGRPKD